MPRKALDRVVPHAARKNVRKGVFSATFGLKINVGSKCNAPYMGNIHLCRNV